MLQHPNYNLKRSVRCNGWKVIRIFWAQIPFLPKDIFVITISALENISIIFDTLHFSFRPKTCQGVLNFSDYMI